MPTASVELDISYHLEDQSDWLDDSERIQHAANWVVERFEIKSLSASISIVDDPTIHRLNREHLDHDWPTDVISFVFEDENANIDGEIIASRDTAARLCNKAGWRAEDELLLYVVHGLLHLAGLDDIEDEDRQEMRAREQECLLSLGVDGAEQHLERWNDVV